VALPKNQGDLEHQKFVEDTNKDVAVRTSGESSIRDADGNLAEVGSWSKALSVQDAGVHGLLHEILAVMKEVRDHLEYITDEEITENGDREDL